MKLFRIVSLFLISILLLAACTSQPATSAASASNTAETSPVNSVIPYVNSFPSDGSLISSNDTNTGYSDYDYDGDYEDEGDYNNENNYEDEDEGDYEDEDEGDVDYEEGDYEGEDDYENEGDWEDEDYYGESPFDWVPLPGSGPEISEADLAQFNPDKIVDYLTAIGEHDYHIEKAEIKDGELLLTIEDSRYIFIFDVYAYLKDEFELTDDEIRNIPIFSDCIIENGEMYVNEYEYEHILANDDCYDDYFYFAIDNIILDPIPVSKDASITLFDYEDNYENYDVTYEQFIDIVLDKCPDMYDMYFKFENGEITAIFQNEEEIF